MRAPEPREILWENLEFSHYRKVFRRINAFILTSVLLVLSFFIIYLAYQQQAILTKSLLDFSFCSEDLPSVYWGGYGGLPEDLSLTRDRNKDNGASGGCPPNEFYIAFTNSSISRKAELSTLPALLVPANETHAQSSMTREEFAAKAGASLCDGVCHPSSSSEKCPVLPSGISNYACQSGVTTDSNGEARSCSMYRKSDPAACYCHQSMTAEFAASGLSYSSLKKLQDNEGDLCYKIFVEYILARATAASATGVIVLVNFALKETIPRMSASELHSSSSGEASGTFVKVSLAQIINTAFSTILANSDLSKSAISRYIPGYNEEVESEKHKDFTKAW